MEKLCHMEKLSFGKKLGKQGKLWQFSLKCWVAMSFLTQRKGVCRIYSC